MGNCNSEAVVRQKCTGCGFKKCDCTAGLNSICGRCDKSWKYQIPGTYDTKYDKWLVDNPKPVKPIFDPQPPLNSMDFVCTQCVQCQDFSGITAGGSLDIKDPSQVMQCIGKMKDKQEAEVAAAEAAAAKAAADAKLAAAAADARATAEANATKASAESQTMIMAFVAMFIILLIIVGVVFSMRSRGGAYEYSSTTLFTR